MLVKLIRSSKKKKKNTPYLSIYLLNLSIMYFPIINWHMIGEVVPLSLGNLIVPDATFTYTAHN